MQGVLNDPAAAAGLAVLERLGAQEAVLFAAVAAQLHDSVVLSRRLRGADGPERFLEGDGSDSLMWPHLRP